MRNRMLTGSGPAGGILPAYLVTIGLLAAGWWWPQLRLWWAWPGTLFGRTVTLGLFLVAVLGGFLLLRAGNRRAPDSTASTETADRRWRRLAALVVAGLAVLFVVGRARAHFLGDGYTLIANLASFHPVIKLRNFGAMLLHLWVQRAAGVPGEAGAEATYQLVSFVAGAGFVIVVAVTAHALFNRLSERLLFLLGLSTAGYMPLFFGHVENYSAFVFAVGIFVLVGVLITRGRVARWLAVPGFLLCVFLHVFGLVLLPAAVFLLGYDTPVAAALKAWSRSRKIIAGTGVLVLAVVLYSWLRSTYPFFRLAFLPVFSDEFTVGGYTLLSPRHLLDVLNLLLLLLPGLFVAVAVLLGASRREWLRGPDIRFLALVLVPMLAAAIVFDPKLGMARDWDLMSFAGVGLAVSAYYVVLRAALPVTRRLVAASVMILLALVTLVPRVLAQSSPDIAVKQFQRLVTLDRVRSRNGYSQLIDYYLKTGQAEQAVKVRQEFDRLYPEWRLLQRLEPLLEGGRIRQAAVLARRLVATDPSLWPAWTALGRALIQLGEYPEAVRALKTAAGLNPHGAAIHANLGFALLQLGRVEEAAQRFHEAYRLNPRLPMAVIGLWRLSFDRGEIEKSYRYARELTRLEGASTEDYRRIARAYLDKGLVAQAVELYRAAVQRGLDAMTLPDTVRAVLGVEP